MAGGGGEKLYFLPVVKGSTEPLHHEHPQTQISDSGPSGLPSLPPSNTVASHSVFTQQLGELTKTLVFAEDALAALCSVPAPCSYASAHQSSKQLFSHRTMAVPIRCRKRVSEVGRHDARGSGSKHFPCHLTQSLPHGIPEEGGTQVCRTAISVVSQLPRTAYYRGGSPSEVSETPRSPCEEHHSSDKDKKPSASTGQISTVSSVAGPKTFMEQVASGAKPLHLLHGRESTILLDNSALFKKVLQPRYPPPPSKVHRTGQAAKKTTAVSESTSERPLAFLRQHRRWLDFPLPIEVSTSIQLHCTVHLLMMFM